MANADRDRDKKRRRQKRLAKRQQRAGQPKKALAGGRSPHGSIPSFAGHPADDPLKALAAIMAKLEAQLKVPLPATWPGASDISLARPDVVKFELADFASHKEPGRTKIHHLEQAARRGLLENLQDLDHWLLEEFFWHGAPGDPWHPVEAFLAQAGDRFPPAAREQLRLWKAARLGIFEIGAVHDDVLDLRDWDVASGTPSGPSFRAITLNIGGVNVFQGARDHLLLTYLAPWVPAQQLYCGMGYSLSPPKANVALLALFLGLAHPEMALRPLPWKATPSATKEYQREWRARAWHAWLGARLRFPFHAVVPMPPQGRLAVRQITGLMSSTAEQVEQFGIYLEIPSGTEMMLAGASEVMPIDAASPNRLALAEYQAYRKLMGPPPGVRGQRGFFTVR
jgi:hypothetical protein